MRIDEINDDSQNSHGGELTNEREIPAENWWRLHDRIDKLNRKAKKLGLPLIQLIKLGEEWRTEKVDGRNRSRLWFKVKVEGESPKLAGWELLASLDHINGGNVIRTVPGKEANIPDKYRTCPPDCDHCAAKRYRANTFLLRNIQTGEIKQIGRQCLKDFLGNVDPKMLLNYASYIHDLKSEMDDDESMSSGGYLKHKTDFVTFMTHVAAMIRLHGWLSKSQAQQNAAKNDENMEKSFDEATRQYKFQHSLLADTPTSVRATQNMFPSGKEEKAKAVNPTAEDIQMATDAIEWAKNIKPKTDLDYNMQLIAKQDALEWKHYGIAAYIIAAYLKHQEWYRADQEKKKEAALAAKNAQKTSEWIGKIGERLKWVKKGDAWKSQGFEAKLTFRKLFDGQFPKYLLKFVTRDGCHLTWWASYDAAEPFTKMAFGQWVRLDGTITKHEVYNDIKQTTIQRGSLVEKLENENED
jgi:hypothetical protein